MMHHYILFQIFHKLSLFLFVADINVILKISHNTPHLRQEKPSHIAIWQKFRSCNNDLYLWKGEVTTSRKVKIFNISLNVVHFSKHFSYTVLYLLVQYTVKSHDFLIYCFESGHFFQEMQLFGKIHFVIFFFFFEQDQVVSRVKWQKMTQNDKK